MIYSQESIIGLDLFEAVDRFTDARDPGEYGQSIWLSENQRIYVGYKEKKREEAAKLQVQKIRVSRMAGASQEREFYQDRGGYFPGHPLQGNAVVQGGQRERERKDDLARIEKQQAADECSKLIRPLFDGLVSGKLQVLCRSLEDSPTKPLAPLPADNWAGWWRLALRPGEVRLNVRPYTLKGTIRLFKIVAATAQAELQAPPAAVETPEAPHMAQMAEIAFQAHVPKPMQDQTKVGSTRPPRGPTKDDEPYHVMMENLIREGRASKPWAAAKILVNIERIVPLDGAQSESVIKRLCNGYKESGRPLTGASLRKNAPVTHK